LASRLVGRIEPFRVVIDLRQHQLRGGIVDEPRTHRIRIVGQRTGLVRGDAHDRTQMERHHRRLTRC
jgi:hypothetical protein